MRGLSVLSVFVATALLHSTGQAEVVDSSAAHFHLKLNAESQLSPDKIWKRIAVPASWWHSDHTYSGDSKNMSIKLQAGGYWREDWEGGSVAHGRVLFVEAPKRLRLDAPFGPLQELAVVSIWTITITPMDKGSTVEFEVLANGSVNSNLDTLAPAVDYVKQQALQALVSSKRL